MPYSGKKAESERLVNRLRAAGATLGALARSSDRLLDGARGKFGAAAVLVAIGGVVTATAIPGAGHAGVHARGARGAPTGPPTGTRLCNGGPDASTLIGPSSPPARAVTIPAGNNSAFSESYSLRPDTTYYFASGVHTLGNSIYSQLTPHNGDRFIGAPGAIIDGQSTNESAVVGSAKDVTIEFLTFVNFAAPEGQMVVNHDGGANWTIEHNTIKNNLGAGVGLGTKDIVSGNCLANNDEYGFSSFGGSSHITLANNEVADNDNRGSYDESAFVVSYSVTNDVATIVTRSALKTAVGAQLVVGNGGGCTASWCTDVTDPALNGTWTIASIPNPTTLTFHVTTANVGVTSDRTGTVSDANVECGCSGGGKFWNTTRASVTSNWVHDNGNVGIWPDTDNSGFNFSHNYIAGNWAEGIVYETSYNAQITKNTFVDNGWGGGPSPALSGFPDPALYLSESGSDHRVPGPYRKVFHVTNNVFTDNWAGVVIYENSNRACGITNDTYCTLVKPRTYTLSSCAAKIPNGRPSAILDYVDNCRWRSQNILVKDNSFNFAPGRIGSDCTSSNGCGFNGLFSEYGTTPSTTHNGAWPGGASYPYAGYTVSNNISNNQGVHFSQNLYCASGGSWRFVGFGQGNIMTPSQWTSGAKNAGGSAGKFGAQDSRSEFVSGGCPY